MTSKKTYKQAYEELEDILSKLENHDLDIDQLQGYVEKASELIKFCKKKIFETEKEVEKIMVDLEDEITAG